MTTLKKILAVLGTILAAIGALFLFRKNETNTKVEELETKVSENDAKIQDEHTKREEIIKSGEKEKAEDVSKEELVDFFNNRPK